MLIQYSFKGLGLRFVPSQPRLSVDGGHWIQGGRATPSVFASGNVTISIPTFYSAPFLPVFFSTLKFDTDWENPQNLYCGGLIPSSLKYTSACPR